MITLAATVCRHLTASRGLGVWLVSASVSVTAGAEDAFGTSAIVLIALKGSLDCNHFWFTELCTKTGALVWHAPMTRADTSRVWPNLTPDAVAFNSMT